MLFGETSPTCCWKITVKISTSLHLFVGESQEVPEPTLAPQEGPEPAELGFEWDFNIFQCDWSKKSWRLSWFMLDQQFIPTWIMDDFGDNTNFIRSYMMLDDVVLLGSFPLPILTTIWFYKAFFSGGCHRSLRRFLPFELKLNFWVYGRSM